MSLSIDDLSFFLPLSHSIYYSICTIDRGFPRQDDDDELQSGIRVLQVSEHGLHAVCALGVFTETRLALDWHPSVLRDLSQLIGEAPGRETGESETTHGATITQQCQCL